MTYSATVDLWLMRGETRVELAQVGPAFVITSEPPESLSLGDHITVFVCVDGKTLTHDGVVSRIEGRRVWTDGPTPT